MIGFGYFCRRLKFASFERSSIFGQNQFSSLMLKPFIRLVGLAVLLATFSCQRPKKGVGEAISPFGGTDTAQVDIVLAGMSLEEKIGQLLIWEAPLTDSLSRDDVFRKTHAGLVGGLLLRDLHLADFLYAADSLRRSAPLPLFMATDQKVSLNNQFKGIQKYPTPASLATIDSTDLNIYLEQNYLNQCKALGINFSLSPTLKSDDAASQSFDFQTFEEKEADRFTRSKRVMSLLRFNRILAVGDALQQFEFIANDSLRKVALHGVLEHTHAGMGGLVVDDSALDQDTLRKLPADYPRKYLSRHLDFKGLMVVNLGENEPVEQKLLSGAELLVTADIEKVFKAFEKLLTQGKITPQDLDQRVRRVLLAKSWVHGGELPVKLSILPHDSLTHKPVKFVSISEKRKPTIVPQSIPRPKNLDAKVDKMVCYFEDPRWSFFIGRMFENSVLVARDAAEVLPLKSIYETDYQVFRYSQRRFDDFEQLFSKYANFRSFNRPIPASGELQALSFEPTKRIPAAIVLLDSIDLQPGFHKEFIESVNALSALSQVVVLNFGNPKNLRLFDKMVACVQIFEKNKFTEAYAAQLIFGGVTSEGRLPLTVDETMPYNASVRSKPVRLSYGLAEKTGIASESLVGINAIAETAIQNGVFPGCQVAVAKDGQVIFSKSFGHFTYGKTAQPVSNTDLFDIASVTKVAATTLAAMHLVEEQKLDINGKVSDYVKVSAGSAVGNIKLKELLLHQSGLQAQMPLSKFFSGKNVPAKGCNDYFCRKRKGAYNVKVADGLYFRNSFQDTILKRVFRLPVSAKPKFRYSDVNFYLLKQVVETVANTPLDKYVFEKIYRPLGLRNIAFKPLEKFSKTRILPTEQDNYWRKTLVQGYVHDPSVALMGGVGGSAGIFSNAEDLAVIFHMLLEGGLYGGYQFFGKNTVDDFVTNKYTNHRGLGFDKPTKRRYPTYASKASPKSFGHTGFTGTCVWVDPELRLVYVFLSNRVNPSSRNGKIFTEGIRSRIHDVVYNAFGTFDSSLPELDVEEEIIEVEEGAGG